MWTNLKIGLKNLRRRRMRTLLTGAMIVVGTSLIVFSVGMNEGAYSDMIKLGTETYSGSLQVVKGNFNDKPTLFKTVDDPETIVSTIKKIPQVVGITGRIETAGLLAAGNNTTGTMLVGLDPDGEKQVSRLPGMVSEGEWLDAKMTEDQWPIVIGYGLAKRLKAGLGDEVSFIGQAADGSMAAELFTVVGIIRSGVVDIDGAMALIKLDNAQEMLVLEDRVHRLVGKVGKLKHIESVREATSLPDGLKFMSWDQVMPQLDHSIKSDRVGTLIFLIIILIVVTLGVSNTMLMAVMERTKEFGIMAAIGATPGRIMSIVISEAVWITLIGVVMGVGLGAIFDMITWIWPIPIAGTEGSMNFGGVTIDSIRAEFNIMGLLYYPAIILLAGMVAGVVPAIRAARLKPVEALRND